MKLAWRRVAHSTVWSNARKNAALQDVRYTLRMMRRNPGFSTILILVLALGIGVNTGIFSIVNATLLRPLPFHNPDQLVLVWDSYGQPDNFGPVSWPNFRDWRDWNRSFSSMSAFTGGGVVLSGRGDPHRLTCLYASASLFETLDVQPAIGRRFRREDDQPAAVGGTNAVILSHELWQSQFGGDRSVLGQIVKLNGTPHTIVGVMPPGFDPHLNGPAPDLYLTAAVFAAKSDGAPKPVTEERGMSFLQVVGRLRPDVTIPQAQRDMDHVASLLMRAYPEFHPKAGVILRDMQQALTGSVRTTLLLVLGAAGVVLLIACADVSGLLLARVTRRQREITIRAALGAGRLRLARQLLAEGLTVAVTGAACGIWMVSIVESSLRTFLHLEERASSRPELRVFLFALAIAALSAIALSLAPALHAVRLDLLGGLKEAALNASESRRHRRIQSGIVLAQLVLAMSLLTAGGLLTASLWKLQNVQLGFEPQHTLTFPVALSGDRYTRERYAPFFQQLLESLRTLPGVQIASAGAHAPMRSGLSRTVIDNVDGKEIPQNRRSGIVFAPVMPAFFRALGTRIEEGRDFSDQDTRESAPVVILNRTAVKRYFGSVNPLGRQITPEMWNGAGSQTRPRTVVGIVADLKYQGPASTTPPAIYWPMAQIPCTSEMYIVLRVTGDPMSQASGVRARLREIDPTMPLYDMEPLTASLSSVLQRPRSSTVLIGSFAGLAVLLTAIGLWGIIACAAAQRTREIGIRMALGASRGSVVLTFVRQGLVIGICGVALGVAGAIASARLLRTLLFGVTPGNALVPVSAAVLLMVVVLVASVVPALRATRLDPLRALRYE